MPRKTKKPPRQSNPDKRPGSSNTLRIIAGQWRGRKLSFATAPGLRPTPDRVRETLFNWLQGHLLDARCLDLFAGSGALGFEAVSRGAGHVTLVESHRQATDKLTANIQLLKTDKISVVHQDAFQFLEAQPEPFDLIFLDPPFRKNYIPNLLEIIRDKGLLSAAGLVYLEHESEEDMTAALEGYEILKEKSAGQVISRLMTLAK